MSEPENNSFFIIKCVMHTDSVYYKILILNSNPLTYVRILKQCFKDQCFLN